MKHSLSVQVWIRCVLGVAAVLGVAVIATGLKTSFPRFSFIDTVRAQEHLIGALHPEKLALLRASATESQTTLADEGPLPDFGGAVGWLNSAPLSRESLRGKVVLVNFWTYSCINSLRELPYMKSWAAKYKDAGLVVIGVHAPEFGFERERANVENAVRELKRYLSSRHRQRPQNLGCVQQRILAGRLLHRRERTNSLSPLRGGRLRRVRACHSETSPGKRSHRPGRERRSHIHWRSRGTAQR